MRLKEVVGHPVVYRGNGYPWLVGHTGQVLAAARGWITAMFRLPHGQDQVVQVLPEDVGLEEEERSFLFGRWVTKADVEEQLRRMAKDGLLEMAGTLHGKPVVYRVPGTVGSRS